MFVDAAVSGRYWLVNDNEVIWFERASGTEGTRAHPVSSTTWDIARAKKYIYDGGAYLHNAMHLEADLSYSDEGGADPGTSFKFGLLDSIDINWVGPSHNSTHQTIGFEWKTMNGGTINNSDTEARIASISIWRGQQAQVLEYMYPTTISRTDARSLWKVRRHESSNVFTLGEYAYEQEAAPGDTQQDTLLTTVKKSGGTLESFTYSSMHGTNTNNERLVDTHRSRGVLLEYEVGGGNPVHHNDRIDWKKNGIIFTSYFDTGFGTPTQCESGICGAPNELRAYQTSADHARVVLGVSEAPQKDGSSILREYDEESRVLFELVVRPGTGPVTKTVTYDVQGSGFDEVDLNGTATMLEARRYYYRDSGELWVLAERQFAPSTDTNAVSFPTFNGTGDPHGWFFTGTIGARENSTITTGMASATTGYEYYSLSIDEADSDNDGILNEPEDSRTRWSISAAESEGTAQIISSTRSTFYGTGSGIEGFLEKTEQLDGLLA